MAKIEVFMLFILFMRFFFMAYSYSFIDSSKRINIPIYKNTEDFIIQRYYISIGSGKWLINWNFIDIFEWKIIDPFDKISYINNKWLCSNMHNGFLYIENGIVWDIRYTSKPVDNWNCFYWKILIKE